MLHSTVGNWNLVVAKSSIHLFKFPLSDSNLPTWCCAWWCDLNFNIVNKELLNLPSWTKVLWTVLQYSYFSLISRFPLKTKHSFWNFLAVLPPPTQTKLKLEKDFGYTHPTLFVGWGEGLELCELENALETQTCPKTLVHDCR